MAKAQSYRPYVGQSYMPLLVALLNTCDIGRYPIWQMGKLKLRRVKWLIECQRASQCQSQKMNPDSLTLPPLLSLCSHFLSFPSTLLKLSSILKVPMSNRKGILQRRLFGTTSFWWNMSFGSMVFSIHRTIFATTSPSWGEKEWLFQPFSWKMYL